MTRPAAVLLAALLVSALLQTGCATYSDRIRDAQQDLVAGRVEPAIGLVNELLDVKSARELPSDLGDDRVLLLVERATLLQAAERYELSARDLSLADERLEWLDIGKYTAAEIARYLYSDDVVPYRAPPYERLLLNALNMLNFLALGDLEGARVEARRLEVIQSYFLDASGSPLLPDLLAFGEYLSGFTFEASRDYEAAASHYCRAWNHGWRSPALRDRLRDLLRLTSWSPRDFDPRDSGLDEVRKDADAEGPLGAAEYRRLRVDDHLLAVVQSGLAPYKRPERVPIGLALTYGAAWSHPYPLSESDREKVQRLAAEGLVTWLNFPVLTRDGLPRGYGADLDIDGRRVGFVSGLDVSRQVEAAWERLRAPLIASAITRLLTRLAVGYGVRKAAEGAAKSGGAEKNTSETVGWLAGLTAQGLLAAADTPDTRSWITLPGRIDIFHGRLPPGEHEVAADVGGRTETRTVRIGDGGPAVVVLSRYR